MDVHLINRVLDDLLGAEGSIAAGVEVSGSLPEGSPDGPPPIDLVQLKISL